MLTSEENVTAPAFFADSSQLDKPDSNTGASLAKIWPFAGRKEPFPGPRSQYL
jgi:hypothetical protein